MTKVAGGTEPGLVDLTHHKLMTSIDDGSSSQAPSNYTLSTCSLRVAIIPEKRSDNEEAALDSN